MWQLSAIVIAVLAVGLAGAALERRGGLWAVVGVVQLLAAGAATGLMLSFGLGLALTPGACVAVLCPGCYHPPSPDQLWRAGLVYFGVLGALAGLLPSRPFRAGYGLSVAYVLLLSGSYWIRGGAGTALLPGLALAVLGLAIRWAAGGWSESIKNEAPGEALGDFWDGSSWADRAGQGPRRPPIGSRGAAPATAASSCGGEVGYDSRARPRSSVDRAAPS